MPTYLYKCPACRGHRDVIKSLTVLNRKESCEACQAPMERQISAPAVVSDYAGYNCPISDKWIEGRRAHEENLKRHGCRIYETGETAEIRRKAASEDAAFDRSVDETVEQFYEALPSEGREALATAVTSGLDVEIARI